MDLVATEQRPLYTVYVVSGELKFNITPAIVSLERSEVDGQIAQRVVMQLLNVMVNGSPLYSILQACDRVYIYANDGSKNDEVFRGFIWNRLYKSSISDNNLRVTAYDHLIYLQQSESTYYFPPMKRTQDIVSTICNDWGIKVVYDYNEITHAKTPLRGKLYEILTSDVLDVVKRHTKTKYVVRSEKDVLYVKLYGTNTTMYSFYKGKNVTSTSMSFTMENVVTQVAIVGEKNDNDYEPIVATVVGSNKSKYGTLQKIITCDDVSQFLWRAKIEANAIIDENNSPLREYEINGPDIPWIRKGDRVYLDAGGISGEYLYVKSAIRSSDIKNSEMTLILENGTVHEDAAPWMTN